MAHPLKYIHTFPDLAAIPFRPFAINGPGQILEIGVGEQPHQLFGHAPVQTGDARATIHATILWQKRQPGQYGPETKNPPNSRKWTFDGLLSGTPART